MGSKWWDSLERPPSPLPSSMPWSCRRWASRWWERLPAAASTTSAPSVAFPCPTPASRLASPPNTSTWAPCWTPTPDGAWNPWSRTSPFPRPWRTPWRAETPPWSGCWPIRRRWNSGNTRTRRSPGGGSWGCCMMRPGPLPRRRRPISRTCWASNGSCRQ